MPPRWFSHNILCMDKMMEPLNQVRRALETLPAKKHLLVAFSAGADSCALLHILNDLKDEYGYSLSAVHINHGLRSASEQEEKYAQNIADSLAVPLIIRKVDVPCTGNLEAAARAARYAALYDTMNEINADVIALAHHAGDQAETLLMHLMSGCGLQGLSGMAEYAPPLWRPLLKVAKSSLIGYLKARNLSWVEDESNRDTRFTRNLLRHEVLPVLERIQSGVELRLTQTADIAEKDNDYLQSLETDWLSKYGKFNKPFCFIDLLAFNNLHLAMKRRIARRLGLQHGITFNFEQTGQLQNFIQDKKQSKIALSDTIYAIKSNRRLHIWADDVKLMTVPWSQPAHIQGGSGYGDGRHEQVLLEDAIAGALIRMPRKDDVINPKGMNGSQSIGKYFSSRGIDVPFRPFWPVFAKDNQVLWVPGHGISREAVVHDTLDKVVRLQFRDRLPDEIDVMEAGEYHV